MDFHVLDGTHEVTTEEDPKVFVDMGFKMPLRSWFKCGEWRSYKDKTPAPANLEGLEETLDYLTKYIKLHGPFDGALTFSQGQMLFRYLYRTIFLIDSDTHKSLQPLFPSFIIAFGGPLFPWQSFLYRDTWYPEDGSLINVPSCHLYGTQDIYKGDFHAHEVY